MAMTADVKLVMTLLGLALAEVVVETGSVNVAFGRMPADADGDSELSGRFREAIAGLTFRGTSGDVKRLKAAEEEEDGWEGPGCSNDNCGGGCDGWFFFCVDSFVFIGQCTSTRALGDNVT